LAGGNIIIAIENNSIGKVIVEDVMMTDLVYKLYYEKDEVDKKGNVNKYGINTNVRTKDLMVAELYGFVNGGPQFFHSQNLVDQLHAIERNNAGQITSSSYTDAFMAACFCAYTRKMKTLEILPLLSYSNDEVQKEYLNTMENLIEMSSGKKFMQKKELEEELFIIPEDHFNDPNDVDDSTLPFFFKV